MTDAPLIIRRRFNAPPERVFDAWTRPDLFARWIGPEGVPCDLIEMDPVVGGRYSLNMNLPGGTVIPVTGIYSVLERPSRIAFTWGHADGSITTQVSIHLRPSGTGCEMEFHHHLPTEDMHASHRDGWTSAFDKLQRSVEI
jgi:uncharacterized protein YndB with AHSA1/START domain